MPDLYEYQKYDVIVIGAGPAGCTAAKTLADTGIKVLLAEKFKIPRYKSCSGVLIKKSMELVKQYFGEETPAFVTCSPADNRGMIFTDDRGREYMFEQDGLNVWRSSFDHWLAEKAALSGAEVRDSTAVVDCEERNSGVDVILHGEKKYTVSADYVINCEGAVSAVKRKKLGTSAPYIITFQTFNTGKIDLDPHYFYAYLQPEFSGYDAWFNVKDDMLVLGVSDVDEARICGYYRKFTEYMSRCHGLQITEQLKSERWLMPRILPGCTVELGKGRIIFAGEAAGFLNPMGEGISSAMESGYAAASSICRHYGDDERIIAEYENAVLPCLSYMRRQWSFVGNLAETFAEMKI